MKNLELVESLQQKSFALILHVLKGGGRGYQVRVPGRAHEVGGERADLPDDAPDEKAVVTYRPPLRHLGHPQVKVHPVAKAENVNEKKLKSFE